MRNSDVIAIQATDLTKTFRDLEAVKGVTFDVKRGEFFGFVGPNGSGKTTTIEMMATLLRPSSGTVAIEGHDVWESPLQVRQAIGIVFQRPVFDHELTLMQTLRIQAIASGLGDTEFKHRAHELLSLFNLWERRNDRLKEYSGGMARRAELARGLLNRPRVLILDEPTQGLDPRSRSEAWRFINDMRAEEGTTVFLTTHYMEEVEQCDRIAVLDRGRIVVIDTPDNLKAGVGSEVVKIKSKDPEQVRRGLLSNFNMASEIVGDDVVVVVPEGRSFVPTLLLGITEEIDAVSIHRPTLDDVFSKMTRVACGPPN